MEFIRCEREGELLLVKLARGKANALNAAMVEELHLALGEAAADGSVRGLVLASDRPRFFSSGFDLAEVFAYDVPAMTTFFGRFIDLYESIVQLPKPVVGALGGHAVAGGAVLALSCDFRLMAEGDYGFALNEVALGVALPEGLHRLVFQAVGPQHAPALLLAGETIRPSRALEIGLVSELASEETLLARALTRARSLAAKPASAYGAIKRALRPVDGDRRHLDRFIGQWFSPESVQNRRALAASLGR
ncbi:MAG: enoyl-CoA hydratase/isomerase family protein [Acidobacteria bacterium]|nr:enoyl-CoA hydratase/isomerase family protein [Acidobacteriota bacterium]